MRASFTGEHYRVIMTLNWLVFVQNCELEVAVYNISRLTVLASAVILHYACDLHLSFSFR